jgi:YD repeat-containing protein
MNRKAFLAATCILMGSTAAFAQTPSLGINFASTDPDAATSSLDPAETAGVVPAANWNNLVGPTGSAIEGIVYDASGTATPTSTTVTWSSPNTWRSGGNNSFPDGPDRKLLSGYLDTGNTAETGIRIGVTNIPSVFTSGGYDVYVYFVSDSGANRGGAYTLNDGLTNLVKYGSTLATPSQFVQDPGTDANISQDGTHLRFIGLQGSSFSLTSDTTLTTPNGFRAPINAIQIVPTPQFGPDFIAQPRSVTVYPGRNVSFSASAEGYPLISSYQWQRNGSDVTDNDRISGATTPTLTINNVAAGDAGNYTLVATSPRGSQPSAVATLEIVPAETSDYITALNTAGPLAHWRLNETTGTNAFDFIGGLTGTYNENVLLGGEGPRPTTFPGFTSANNAPDFQGSAAPGQVAVPTPRLATNAVTIISWINPSFAQPDYTGIFMTRATTQAGLGYTTDNQLGYTWNNNSTWSWQSGLRPPDAEWSMVAIVIQPDRATLFLGANGTLTAAVNPIAHTAETWGENAVIGNDPGGASRNFTGRIDEVAIFNRALSFAEVAALYEEATGIPQALPPTISPQPQSATLYAGATATFRSGAAGEGVTFQWQRNGSDVSNDARISGATTDTLTITGITDADAGDYTLIARNAQGPVTSDVAALTVVPTETPAYVPLVLNLDPVSFYRLNETGDPSTGTEPVLDLWSGRNGTYGNTAQNGIFAIEGPRPPDFDQFEASNYALQPTADFANSWATVPGPGFTSDTATIVAWINPNTLVTNAGIVFARAGQPATGLNIGGTLNLGYHWLDTAASYQWDSGLAPALNQWSLAAIVVEPDRATAYLIDSTGLRSATNVTTHAARAFTDNIRIGGDPNNVNRTFDGRIDEVAIFDRALSAAQVQSLYTGEAVDEGAELQVTRGENNQITITWDGAGTLQSTTALQEENTQWTNETTTGNSFTTTASGDARFFRIVR